MPTEIGNYREIFLGGGSVLFAVLSHIKSGRIRLTGAVYAYDINEPLIYVYKNIQTAHMELYVEIQEIIVEYSSCCKPTDANFRLNRKPVNLAEAKEDQENYYYWIRSRYNSLSAIEKTGLVGSAMFIFLNKTCFRGVFRLGPRGFNVPFGHYTNPEIINMEHLVKVHELIQGVVFECCDFEDSLDGILESQDFIYLDPPYAPETATSFVGYTTNGFDQEKHLKLFEMIHGYVDKKIMMTNADVKLVRDHFLDDKYNINSILCKRTINSKNPDAKAKDVIIKNY